MNTRQQLYKKYRLEGYSKYTSARKAGYAHNTALQAKNIEKYINMDYWLENEGLTDTALAKHAEKGLNATKQNDPDWSVRHKYFDTILKLRGKLKDVPIIDKSKHTYLTKVTIQELQAKTEEELIETFRRIVSKRT